MTRDSVHAWKKFLLWCARSIAFVLFILVLLHFLIPEIISLQPIREKIRAGISQKIAGAVDFQKLEISLFPRPEAVITNARLSLPGKAQVSVKSTIIVPRLLPFFTGKVRIQRIRLVAPHVSLILPKRDEETKRPFSIEDTKKKVKDFLNAAASRAYRVTIDLEKASFDIADREHPLFSFQDLDGRIVLSRELRLALSCRSSISKRLSCDIRLNPELLTGAGTLTLSGANPRAAMRRIAPKLAGYIGDSEGNLAFSFAMNGMDDIRAEIRSAFDHVSLLFDEKRIQLNGIGMSGGVVMGSDKYEVRMNEVKMKSPRLTLGGSLLFEKKPEYITLSVSGSHLDMASIRGAALGAAGHVGIVRDIFTYVRGGEVPYLEVRSRGATFDDLGRTANVSIRSAIRKGDIFIPGPQLACKAVDAECDIARGILKAKNVLAEIGKTKVRDCRVTVGLKGRDVPLHIDAAFSADLGETKDLLRRVIKNQEFTKQADSVNRVEGKASGRIVLGENTASLKPRIYVAVLSFTADHRRVPFPVSVRTGEFSYNDKGIDVRKLSGTFGRSSFEDLFSEVRLGDTASIEISSGKFRLVQDELFPWLKSFDGLKGPLEDIRSVRGAAKLNVHHLTGPLENPPAWRFKLSGSIEDLILDSAFSPEPVYLEQGKILADEQSLSLTDVRAEMLDGRLGFSGTHRGYAGDSPVTELEFSGEMGPQFLAWAGGMAGLPSQLYLKNPFTFERAHLVLGEGAVSFDGQWKVRYGPEISASVFKDSKGLAIKDLIIRDAVSDAALSIDLREKTMVLGFAGKLSSETLNKMIAGREFRGGKITGNIRAEIGRGRPFSFRSRGELRAENISFSLKGELPLTIENLSMGGDGSRLSVNSSSLVLDGNPLSLRGTLESTPEATAIDMDVSAGRIEWEKMAETAGKMMEGEEKKADEVWDLPVEGSVRLHAHSFSYGGYVLTPLMADMRLGRNAVDISIKRSSLCGVSFLGNVAVAPSALSIDLQLSTRNAELEHALRCLGVADSEVLTGTFDLTAKIRAEGKKEDLLHSLEGRIDFSAKNGRIYGDVSLMKIFDFLEPTQLITGLPQMRREGVAYQSISAKGELGAGLLEIKEVVMDCPSLKIAAQGSVDLKQKQMDFGVLVCPFKRTSAIISKIPVLGGILGRGFASIPLKVSGELSAPKVSSHPVSAVGSGLVGILGRTLQSPVKLFDPFLKDEKQN